MGPIFGPNISAVRWLFHLTLFWVGFLGVRFEGVEEGGKIIPLPNLKLVKIMLETQIWHVSTHPYVVSENIPFSA